MTREHSAEDVLDVHERGLNLFGRGVDSGSAVMNYFGGFVGISWAGNDYTGVGCFTAAATLLSARHISQQSRVTSRSLLNELEGGLWLWMPATQTNYATLLCHSVVHQPSKDREGSS